jgi:hypothetical protein
MSKACKGAAKALRDRKIPDFICHYHFVADIGTDLLRRNHDRLKQFLKLAGVTKTLRDLLRTVKAATWDVSERGSSCNPSAALVYWVLHGDGPKTPPFPYGLEHLDYYERIRSASEVANLWVTLPWPKELEKCVGKLEEIAKRLEEESGFKTTVRELLSAKRLFDEFREILRLEKDPSQPRQPLLPEVEVDVRVSIEEQIDRFVEKLERRAPSRRQLYDKSPCHIILDHIRRYRQHLFGHPVVRDETGQVIHVVDRTNNPLETFFSTNKQGLRRRTGRKHLTRDLEDLPPKAVLVENLRDPTYVRIVCGSLENLPDAFATLRQSVSAHAPLRPRPDADLKKQVRTFCNSLHAVGSTRIRRLTRTSATRS